MTKEIINTTIGGREVPFEIEIENVTKEINTFKKEYEEYKERKNLQPKDNKITAVIMTQLFEDNGCELRIKVLPQIVDETLTVKQFLRYALIDHFEKLIKNKENPIFQRIEANIRTEKFKKEHKKQLEGN